MSSKPPDVARDSVGMAEKELGPALYRGTSLWASSSVRNVQIMCSPPMRVVFGDVTVQDTAHGLSVSFPGTF